jgi:3-oxoacyl-[acyl-carrier protein] reductase
VTTVLVSGASRSIGRATALALAARGADLGLLGRPSPELDETVELVRGSGVRVESFACDLARTEDIERAAQDALERLGTPDVLVSNAAVIHRAPVEQTSPELFDEQLAVNLRAPFLLVRALLPAMRRAGRGRLLFVGSISSTLGTARAAVYCASKWGLVGFMKSLAEELSDSGLMTLAVLPGSVDTPMLEGSGFRPRMQPEDVALTLVHYALDAPLAHNGAVVEMFGT